MRFITGLLLGLGIGFALCFTIVITRPKPKEERVGYSLQYKKFYPMSEQLGKQLGDTVNINGLGTCVLVPFSKDMLSERPKED